LAKDEVLEVVDYLEVLVEHLNEMGGIGALDLVHVVLHIHVHQFSD
jgi:hypothetical protein